MHKLCLLSNGNLIAPSVIMGLKRVPNKGVVLAGATEPIIDFIPEPDADRQTVIVTVLNALINSGRHWVQPDWPAEFAKVSKPIDPKVSPIKVENKSS